LPPIKITWKRSWLPLWVLGVVIRMGYLMVKLWGSFGNHCLVVFLFYLRLLVIGSWFLFR
jgi:hypothetical protein